MRFAHSCLCTELTYPREWPWTANEVVNVRYVAVAATDGSSVHLAAKSVAKLHPTMMLMQSII